MPGDFRFREDSGESWWQMFTLAFPPLAASCRRLVALTWVGNDTCCLPENSAIDELHPGLWIHVNGLSNPFEKHTFSVCFSPVCIQPSSGYGCWKASRLSDDYRRLADHRQRPINKEKIYPIPWLSADLSPYLIYASIPMTELYQSVWFSWYSSSNEPFLLHPRLSDPTLQPTQSIFFIRDPFTSRQAG